MANIFKPKRSNVVSSVPTTSNLEDGEMAVNSADKKIYLRDGENIKIISNYSENYWNKNESGISTSSNVGIGTTNSDFKLNVLGDVKVGVNTSMGIVLTSPSGYMFRLIVDDLGNLSTVQI